MKDRYGNEHSETDGRFVSNGSTPAEQARAEELIGEEKRTSSDITRLLGNEYKGYKGQQAVDKLMQEKQGHIKAAFRREDIGDIDLIWGDDGSGLQHLINSREKQGITDIDDFVSNLTDVVEYGRVVQINAKGRFEILKDGKIAVIAPQLRDGKITYLFTAYKTRKK